MLANHDQNIQSRFRLLKVCLCVKLESSVLQDLMCKSAKLDQSKLDLIDQSSYRLFSAEFSNSSPSPYDM